MKKVLVTGGSGFVGQETIPLLLKKNFEIHLASYPAEKSLGMESVIEHPCNLLEKSDVDSLIQKIRPSHLLHLAWDVTHGEFWESPKNHLWVDASVELFKSFASAGGKRAVYAGTCAEQEADGSSPKTLYGISKNEVRKRVEALAKFSNVSFAWGRIFFIYGPREDSRRLVASAIRTFLKGKIFECKNPSLIRDFMHTKDVASAFVEILDNDAEGIFSIGSNEETSLGEVIKLIAKKLNGEYVFGQPKSEPKIIADNSRLKKETSWRKIYSLESGLDDTIRWWKEKLKSESNS